MSLQSYWQGLHDKRLDWAHGAYKVFMDSLDERVRACFADSDTEASVALFGRTQVGKTTLLLNLLGIDEQYLPQINRVLRGGRSAGQSATATAMQYHRAADDNWYLKINQLQKKLDEQQLAHELGQLRASVEEGLFMPADPVEIGIPRKYFAERSCMPQVRILDLPGDNPQDPQEAEHVHQVASRYLPMADLILIVGKLDDLSFLNPQAFTLPGIRDWRYTPDRFRVITTFSFSLQSEKEWAKRESDLDVAKVRAHVMQQIETHSISLGKSAGAAHLYFPLDFGESWQNVRSCDPETFQRMNGFNTQLMDELLVDIAKSATVHGRLRQAADSHIVAMRVKQEESQKMHARLEPLILAKDQAESNVIQARELVEFQKAKAAKAMLPSFGPEERSHIQKKCRERIKCPDHINNLGGLTTETGALAQRISECCNHLLAEASALEADDILPFNFKVRNFIEHAPQSLRKALNSCFSALRQKLDGYVVEEYFPSISDDFAEDKACLRILIEKATHLTARFSADTWVAAVEVVLRHRELELDGIKRELATFEHALRVFEQKFEQSRDQLIHQQNSIREFERDMDLEMERGDRFFRYLHDAFNEELAQRRRAMTQEPSASRRLLELLACRVLCDERDKLLNS